MPNEANKGGRPKNVNEKMLEDALAPILAKLASVEGLGGVVGGEGPVPRGLFFLHLMTGMTIHMGPVAFSGELLETMKRNADDFYEAYCQITQASYEQPTARQHLAEEQERRKAVEQELDVLRERIGELESEQAALAGGPDEGDLAP